jgi:GntR family transcriptional regulator/MocR family aminotransferase
MKDAINKYLGSSVEIVSKGGGLAILINPKVNFDWTKLNNLSEKKNIKLYYAKEKSEGNWQAIRMGFGGFQENEIEEAINEFSKIWHLCILKN